MPEFEVHHVAGTRPRLPYSENQVWRFDLADVDVEHHTFLTRLASSYHLLPYDPYDVPSDLERLVAQYHPTDYPTHLAEWSACWATQPEPSTALAFWTDRIPAFADQAATLNLKPYRRRSCFQYEVTPADAHWRITERGAPAYTQATDDLRARVRRFASPSLEIVRDHDVLRLMASLAETLSARLGGRPEQLTITMHQMLTLASPNTPRLPAPEGLHQDGVDYVVSAIVIEKENIVGGESIIYQDAHKQNRLLLETLEPGQGILQADMAKDYWHEVTPISPADPDKPAYRSILGFDIELRELESNAATH